MNLKLNGQLALVTGATKGIGFAIAQRLVEEGARVIVCGRNVPSLRRAQEQLGGKNKVSTIQCDLATATGANALIEKLKDIGEPDILINNVGFFEVRNFFETSDADWTLMFELNVMSGVRLARAGILYRA